MTKRALIRELRRVRKLALTYCENQPTWRERLKAKLQKKRYEESR